MNFLFVIAMKKEALDVVREYNLEKIDNCFYKNKNMSLIITDIGRNSITASLLNLILKYNYELLNSIIINIGLVGSNKLEVGKVCLVNNSFGYHFDLTPFGDKLYYANYSPIKLDVIDNIDSYDCYTSDSFVLKTDIKEPVLF